MSLFRSTDLTSIAREYQTAVADEKAAFDAYRASVEALGEAKDHLDACKEKTERARKNLLTTAEKG